MGERTNNWVMMTIIKQFEREIKGKLRPDLGFA